MGAGGGGRGAGKGKQMGQPLRKQEVPAVFSTLQLHQIAFIIYSKTASFETVALAINKICPERNYDAGHIRHWSLEDRWEEKLRLVDREVLSAAMPILRLHSAARFRQMSEMAEYAKDNYMGTELASDAVRWSVAFHQQHRAQEDMIVRSMREGLLDEGQKTLDSLTAAEADALIARIDRMQGIAGALTTEAGTGEVGTGEVGTGGGNDV